MEYRYNPIEKEAVTIIPMGQVTERLGNELGERRLYITTGKGFKSGTLRTSATVFWCGAGRKQHLFGFGHGGDYRADIAVIPCARAAEKVTCAAHEAAAKDFQPFIDAAFAWYATGKDKE